MPHDFAKSAQRHKQQLAKQNRTPPVSKGFIVATLILAAGFIAFLLYLGKMDPQADIAATRNATTQTTEPSATRISRTKRKKNEFEFYTLLPESEVVTPQIDNDQSATKTANIDSDKSVSKIADNNVGYLIQAGAFRNHVDADRLRASLILQGLDSKITQATGSNGTLWHRVIVGPFNSRTQVNRAQNILAATNTESLVIKITP